MATNQIFQYNGSPITFQIGGTLMVNATQMAKSFGKFTKDWLSNKATQEFLTTLSAVRTIPLTELVVVKQGGNTQGTWMHEDVSLEFARWLNPAFAIWCNDRIKELLLNGSTSINQETNSLNQELAEANAKINRITARLDATQMELNYLKGRMEVEKELIAFRATIEAEKRIAILEYRLSQSDKQPSTPQRPKSVPKEIQKRTTELPIEPELFTSISQPDYAWSCRLASKNELKKNYPDAMLITEMSRRIKKEYGIYIKSGDIFEWFRTNGFLTSDIEEFNKPSADCMKNKWILYVRRRGTNSKGLNYCTPYITAEGYAHFSRLILQSCNEGGVR